MSKYGFTIRETRHVDEINADVSIYSHDKSGARLIHIDADDDNKSLQLDLEHHPQTILVLHILWNILYYVVPKNTQQKNHLLNY